MDGEEGTERTLVVPDEPVAGSPAARARQKAEEANGKPTDQEAKETPEASQGSPKETKGGDERQPHDIEGDPKDKKRVWKGFNYTSRLALMFGVIAAMTALCTIFVMSFVWGQHFKSYTEENLQTTAASIAERISEHYGETKGWDAECFNIAESVEVAYPGVGIAVVDRDGTVLFDSSLIEDSPSKPLGAFDKIKTANIICDDQVVGSVRLWVSGSDSLLRDSDLQFRNNSYRALLFAGVVAIFLACIIGFFFARTLVRPIDTMTKTAEAIEGGDLSARTGLTGNDEISHLGEAFDAMAESMENDRNLERRLTTDVAHELRTPLMAIQSTVEAMIDGVFPADEDHLMTVNSEVQRLSRLVGSMLKLSRLENRANPMKREVVDVGELVNTIVTTHQTFVEDSGLTLKYEAQQGVYVMGDPDMIRQATANLISNAVRYTPEGGYIWVRVRRGEIMASISVEDTGVGLTPEEAKMVFSRFWRADSGRQRESGGLGIGLSVVKEIVDRHGGWVQVEGRKGEGARFTIHLPLFDEQREAKARKRAAKNTQKFSIQPLRKK